MNDEPDEICVTLPDFSIAVTRDEPSLLALAAEWDALHARSRTQRPYTRHDWIVQCWARHRHNRGSRLHVVTVRQAGRLVAIVPLRTEPGLLGLRLVRWLDSATPFYSDVLCNDAPEGVAALREAAAMLRRDRRLLRFKLENVPSDAAAIPLLEALGATASDANIVSTVDLTRFADDAALLAGLSQGMRRDYRVTLRRLHALGRVEILRLTEPAELADAVAWTFATKLAQLRSKGTLPQWLADPRTAQLFSAAAEAGLRSDACRLYALRLDGDLIATELLFVGGRTGFFSKSAINPRFANVSVGTLCHVSAILALRTEGVATLDLMLGDYHWKQRMRTGTYGVATYRAPGALLRAFPRVARQSA